MGDSGGTGTCPDVGAQGTVREITITSGDVQSLRNWWACAKHYSELTLNLDGDIELTQTGEEGHTGLWLQGSRGKIPTVHVVGTKKERPVRISRKVGSPQFRVIGGMSWLTTHLQRS